MAVLGSVSVLLLRPLAAALGAEPAALAAFYRTTDLTAALLEDQDARVSPAQQCVAWSEVARLSGDRQIALRIASAIPPGAFGVVEYVCRSAPTLGAGLRQWVRYLNLLDDAIEVALVEEGEHSCVRVIRESEAPAPAAHELCFGLLLREARSLCAGPLQALAVRFTHPAPGDVAAYRRWFHAPVRFGAERTELVLPTAALAQPLRSADPELARILERHADALTARPRAAPTLSAQVKRQLATALRDDEAQADDVARRLGLSARSLQRRLKDEGTTLIALRDEVRSELATRYLSDGHSIAEISFLLGFSEPSAFFRAFKRWFGRTPLESRAALRGS